MDEVTLSLVGSENESNDVPDVYSFERRRETRNPAEGTATLIIQTQKSGQLKFPFSTVELIDISQSGMAFKAKQKYDITQPVVVNFPPHGAEHEIERQGMVVWCKRMPKSTGGGYQIAMRFDMRAAA